MSKVIVTVAVTGSIHVPSMSPYLPITPVQIADEVLKSAEAGAAVAHIHVRDRETGKPISDPELFQEVYTRVKRESDIVLCLTTGGPIGATTAERVSPVTIFKPELASFNFGSFNFALFHVLENMKDFKFTWEKPYLEGTEDFIHYNTFKTLKEFSNTFYSNGTRPELEIYDAAMINNVAFMLKKGHLKKPIYLQFVLGVLGGIPASLDNLLFMYKTARELIGDFVWSACAAGRHQIPITTLALLLGGNVRVGLEDSLYISKGVLAKSNAEQVKKIVTIAGELGLKPATPEDARKILSLKGSNNVNICKEG